MLYLFTDFGWQGPYVGQMKSKVVEIAHRTPIIDLMHDVPQFNVKAGAYLLSAVSSQLPQDCVVSAVVDPRVGSEQKGIVLRADYRWYIGPDNGLFDIVAQHANSCHWYEINYKPEYVSNSFHGRDIYVPVAAKLLTETAHETFLIPIEKPAIQRFIQKDINEIIYIDQFGNLMTGIRASTINTVHRISFYGQQISRAKTFSDVRVGHSFFYENSQGLIEIAINSGSAQAKYSAKVGDLVTCEEVMLPA